MLSIIKKYNKENILFFIIFICLLFVAVFNAFMNIGIIEDGCHHFWEALIADNIWLGHEGETTFPFNSRYFPSLIQHLSVGITAIFGLKNIKILLFIFTFVSYFLPVLFLFIIYLNIPKYKKENFEIISLSFLICLNFLIYLVWAENFITGLFLWTIFVIYYYIDFDKLSKINLISLIVFSLCLISSHPMTAVFVLPMIVFAIIKQLKTKNVPKSNQCCLITSYILLFIAFVFNLYFMINPIINSGHDYSSFIFIQKYPILYFSFLLIFTLIISVIKINKNLKYFLNFLFILICCGMLYFVLFKIKSYDGYTYRVLGFYIPLLFMLFILFKDFFKLIINYKYIKILNFILLFIFIVHSIYYGKLWNEYLINIKNIMVANEEINYETMTLYNLHHDHLFPQIFILVPNLFNIKTNCKIIISGDDRSFFEDGLSGYSIKDDILSYKKQLSKFDIETDIFIMD